MLFDESLRYLLSLGHETLAIKLGLEAIERLLDALGRPQASFHPVQIAGTNGKGSTAVVLEAVLRAAQIKTGLYTSPHLARITERIRIDGQEIAEEDFARLTTTVRDAAQRLCDAGVFPALPTFFEHVTAIAFLAFKEAGVPLAILETGLGGRLDATTIARAETIGLTPIALDHQEYLGRTLALIAAEKAAIIRPGTRAAVVAPQLPEAMEVIEQRCREAGVKPLVNDCRVEMLQADEAGRLRASFRTPVDFYENVQLGLRGRHQTVNVSVAVRLAETLRERGFAVPREAIISGIERARHPGRLELWEGAPAILFDGAHNEAGARALREYLDEFVRAPITLVFGAMLDKDLKAIGELLFRRARRLILTEMKNPRAANHEKLVSAVPESVETERVHLASSPAEAVRLAYEHTEPSGLICVSGSLYLVGEIREAMQSAKCKVQNDE